MEKIATIKSYWEKDCIIDQSNISEELTKIPKLHCKYLTFYTDYKIASQKASSEYKKMKNIRYEYYSGLLDLETLKEYKWEPFELKVGTKSNIDKYIESDEILLKLLDNKAYYDTGVELCKIILDEIKARTWQIRSLIEYQKFINGN